MYYNVKHNTYIHIHTHIHVYRYKYMHTCIIYVYIYVYVTVYVYRYVYIYMYICIHMYNTQLFGHIWPYVEYTQIKYIALHYITLPCNVLHYIGLHLHYIHTHRDTCYQSVPCQRPHGQYAQPVAATHANIQHFLLRAQPLVQYVCKSFC